MWIQERAQFSALSPLYDQKFKQARDNNNVFVAFLTDLYKAFDCINHEPLIAKLNAYGFDSPSPKFVSAYSNFRKQKTKVSSTLRDYLNLFGVPQGSIAGPLFFNVNICDMFFQIDTSSSLAMQMIIPLLLQHRTTKN